MSLYFSSKANKESEKEVKNQEKSIDKKNDNKCHTKTPFKNENHVVSICSFLKKNYEPKSEQNI